MSSERCIYCFEDFEARAPDTTQFGCGHRAHSHCVWDWLINHSHDFKCPVCRVVILDAEKLQAKFHDPAERARRLTEKWRNLVDANLSWLWNHAVRVPLEIALRSASIIYHTLWLWISITLSALLYGVAVVAWFHWLMKWPLLNESVCWHTRQLMPIVEHQMLVIIDAIDLHRSLLVRNNDPQCAKVTVLFILLRQALRFILDTSHLLLDNPLLCGPCVRND